MLSLKKPRAGAGELHIRAQDQRRINHWLERDSLGDCDQGREVVVAAALDNRAEIMALLDKRLKEAEAKIIASPQFQALKARSAHMLWEHGSTDICTCPEWNNQKFPNNS